MKYQDCECCTHKSETTAGCNRECKNERGNADYTPYTAHIYGIGWICPKCGTVLSPNTAFCMCSVKTTC